MMNPQIQFRLMLEILTKKAKKNTHFLTTYQRSINLSADIISCVEFNQDGDLLATGDKGGRVVIFQRDPAVRFHLFKTFEGTLKMELCRVTAVTYRTRIKNIDIFPCSPKRRILDEENTTYTAPFKVTNQSSTTLKVWKSKKK